MIIDTTLREGAQMFGVRITDEHRKSIAMGLAHVGVEEIEAGWIGQKGLQEFLQWSGPILGDSHISVWSRCRNDDVLRAEAYGARRINLGVPASDAHLKSRLNLSRSKLVERMTTVVQLACSKGMEVSVGFEDASRAEREWLVELAQHAQKAGAFRARLSDTVGLWSPVELSSLLAYMATHTSLELAVHCHNDFGMGTANAICALQSGATWADASLMGLGERSGLAATEEIAGYLTFRTQSSNYSMENIHSLCSLAATMAHIPVGRNKPVVGKDIFASETGVHLHGMVKDPALFEPYAPELVNQERKLGFGEKSGGSAILDWLTRKGIHVGSELVERIRESSARQGRPLTLEECAQLATTRPPV